ncbi:hypothetical protein L1987_35560 [Smallanthus sonchifolius]|uniref:Uncharacterized protein n=1 Tax=Smallanthus sonchifolius TaxID=185202 RepID=A0ACB9HCP9_9ASTR|nr:hypothetical protein L1987_35560 [Smallanthus sonchifolius]
MPRKKDPPPSTLPPRRSARGASKSTSLLDGEDAESFVVPLVGFGDTRVGEDSLQPSLLPSGTNLCNINKEISLVPSVTVSLDESEQGLRSINKEIFLENSASAGTLLVGKTGLAGSVTGLSDGSPGVRSFSGSRNDTDGVGFAVVSPKPPVTPLFSPEFKAMLGREYPRKTVFSPRPMLIGESISMPVAHGSSPDVGVHVHVPEDGDEHGSAVHSVHAKEGTNLSSGVALDEGVQATTKVWNGMHASAELHGGGDLPMPKPLGVEVVQDVQVHVPGTGQESEFEVKAIEENHSGPVASIEGIHGLHGVYGEVGNEVLHVLNREEGLHVHSNVVHGGLDEVPMQPIEVAKVAPEGGDGINVGLVDDGVGKIQFSQEAIPVIASINLMGMGGFKTGHAKSKESNPKDNIKESHMNRMDNLFDDLVARRVKLKEIASNINTTDENKKLVNSLLAMKSYKVLKFSAKKNEAGQVTIDENMVEQDKGPDTNIPTPNKGTQSTYAAMLTGQTSGLIYERNILNRPTKNAPPASSNKNRQASNQDSITHPINTSHHGTSDQPLVGKPNTPRIHSNRVKGPSIELLETSNRFVLLDDEGNELPSIQEGTSQQPNDNDNNFAQGNDKWRMKQERLINIKYMQLITQEQRYEAKRYVIDRLVPLDSSISEWPKPMLEYFRHLCSIYEFGDGTLATTHEKMNSSASLREEHDNVDTIIEEVESEEDGTAEMMKSDSPSIPITSEGTEEGLASFEPTDMLVDGKKAGVN